MASSGTANGRKSRSPQFCHQKQWNRADARLRPNSRAERGIVTVDGLGPNSRADEVCNDGLTSTLEAFNLKKKTILQ